MKILFEVGSTCIGGAERVILKIARGIRKLRPDWELECIVLCDRGGLEQEYRDVFGSLMNGPRDYRDSGKHLARILHNRGYNIVHCIDSFEATRFAASLCPSVAFVQNVFPNVAVSPFAPNGSWLNDSESPYAAIVTEFAANLEHLPKPTRAPGILRAIPNGIDTDFWNFHPETIRTLDVLWCARTDKEKGIDTAMALAPMLARAGMSFTLVTSECDGPLDKLSELSMLYLGKGFRWQYRLRPEDLRTLYRKSKIFIQTSLVEGMPAAPLEAAACGCIPLVSAVDGVKEAFQRTDALLVDPTATAADWFDRIRDAMELWVRPSNSDHLRSIVVNNYSLDKMVNAYIALYEEIAAK